MAQNIEKRGIALNESKHMKQFIVLRNGELKFFDSDTLKLLACTFLHDKFTCTAGNKRLEVSGIFPLPLNFVFKFVNNRELLSWYDAIKESQKIEQKKQTKRLNYLKAGIGIYLNNSKINKKVLWLDGNQMKWAKNKFSEYESINLSNITELSYTNLKYNGQAIILSDPKRILTFHPIQENEIKDLYLGIQWVIAAKSERPTMRFYSESGFYYRKLQLKIAQKAKEKGYCEYLKSIVKHAIASIKVNEDFSVNLLLGTSRNQVVRKHHCRSHLPLQTSYCQPDKKLPIEILPNSICITNTEFNKENNPPEESFNIEPEALDCSNEIRQRPMCEQSFSVDASWEIPHNKIIPRERQELEGQCTSRFRELHNEELTAQNTEEDQITKLKERIQELMEENANNKMQADYWRNQFTQTTQSLDEGLCELSELKEQNNKLNDELFKLREENSALILELE